jgi:hypothetical protein
MKNLKHYKNFNESKNHLKNFNKFDKLNNKVKKNNYEKLKVKNTA